MKYFQIYDLYINLIHDSSRLIAYCKMKLQMLLQAGVKPILVFDGCRLIMKGNTEDERRK